MPKSKQRVLADVRSFHVGASLPNRFANLVAAKQYLWRHGVNPDPTVDPIELLTSIVKDFEALIDDESRQRVRVAVNGRPSSCTTVSPLK